MTLHLLPNLLGETSDHSLFLPKSVDQAVANLDGLIAESATGGRRYLKRFKTKKPPNQIPIALIREDIDFLLEPVVAGEEWGVVSDAGLPIIADPGAKLVLRARRLGLNIMAYPGPSSITMALLLSGLPAQFFTFQGYLPKDPKKRESVLKEIEKQPQTHLFIEAPYRNQHTFETCLKVLRPTTLLSVASNLTLPDQFIKTDLIKNFVKSPLTLEKKPVIFLINSCN